MPELLRVEGMRIRMPGPARPVAVVDGVDFAVDEGESSASRARAAAARR